ncbi:MAG: histidine kinase [Labilithrix sp.]|nr:histidine kinase [Labilithrix sp.]MCW5835292.1 histidine kinase [Labilithrix sp.]
MSSSGPSARPTSLLVRLVPGATGHPEPVVRRRLLTGLTIVVVSIMLQTVPSALRAQHAGAILVRFSWSLLGMLALTAVLTSIYDWHQRRRSSTAYTLVSALIVALALSSVFAAVFNLGLVHLWPSLRGEGPPRPLAFTMTFGLVIGMLHAGVWALAFVFPYVAEDAALRALEADKLRLEAEQLKTTAELARLRSQLEPHFLLNTLNAVAGLVTENPREARRLIACLGDLLRDSLRDAEELQPLEDEVAWLRRYAEILESRHAGTLCFVWEIEPSARRVLLPRLLLQPLVENAVKHGALRRRGGGVVTVRAAMNDARRVVCTIEDNGPGLPDAEPRQGAFGLRSVRRRLELKFPDAVLRMESSTSGTRSIVELPGSTIAAKELS